MACVCIGRTAHAEGVSSSTRPSEHSAMSESQRINLFHRTNTTVRHPLYAVLFLFSLHTFALCRSWSSRESMVCGHLPYNFIIQFERRFFDPSLVLAFSHRLPRARGGDCLTLSRNPTPIPIIELCGGSSGSQNARGVDHPCRGPPRRNPPEPNRDVICIIV